MYSSLGDAGLIEIEDRQLIEIAKIPNFRHLVLIRNPYKRLTSFFADKLRTNLRRAAGEWHCDSGEWQYCQRIFFPLAGVTQDDSFNTIRDGLLSITFEEFVESLPVISWENHLKPQVNLLNENVLGLVDTHEIFRMETDIEIFWDLISVVDPPHSNKSNEAPDIQNLEKEHIEIINNEYKNDFLRFNYELMH